MFGLAALRAALMTTRPLPQAVLLLRRKRLHP
jgi:hypothetical protein